MDVLAVVKQLLELGWPALVTVGVYLIARQFLARTESEIAFLREQVLLLQAEVIKLREELSSARQ